MHLKEILLTPNKCILIYILNHNNKQLTSINITNHQSTERDEA